MIYTDFFYFCFRGNKEKIESAQDLAPDRLTKAIIMLLYKQILIQNRTLKNPDTRLRYYIFMKNFLFFFGLFLIIACPLYQLIDMRIKNQPGDGIERYGDNFVFKNILGVKIDYSQYVGGEDGWYLERSEILTPLWMQTFGIPAQVQTGYNYEDSSWWKSEGYSTVIWLRFLIKCIPIVLIFFGIGKVTSKKE